MIDVVCVGILVADVIVSPVEEMPEKGILCPVDSIELFSGGNAMTAAINLKKMGQSSAIIGMVGRDRFGDFLSGCLEQYEVCIDGLKRTEKAQTSASTLLISEGGERSFWHCEGANGVFSIDDIDMEIVKQANTVFVTGSFLMNTFDGAQTAEFLKRCKELGKTTVLDVCWDSKGRWGTLLNQVLPYLDIFMPSIDEAREIAGKDTVEEMSETFLKLGAKSVVIKCGSDGCYLRESIEASGVMIPACKRVTAVDTTGAGDSFCSGFLAAFSRGMDLKECALMGNATGAHCVMERGATTGIKSFEEMYEFMCTQKEG